MLVDRVRVDMQKKLKTKEDRQSEALDCSVDTCKFPKTCKWNLKCMQRELTLSMGDKGMEKEKRAGKEKRA